MIFFCKPQEGRLNGSEILTSFFKLDFQLLQEYTFFIIKTSFFKFIFNYIEHPRGTQGKFFRVIMLKHLFLDSLF